MKQKDIALIIVVVFISVVISIVASKFIFTPKKRHQTVQVVSPISADFPTPDTNYFNNQSIDVTKIITIGNSTNPDPFSNAQ